MARDVPKPSRAAVTPRHASRYGEKVSYLWPYLSGFIATGMVALVAIFVGNRRGEIVLTRVEKRQLRESLRRDLAVSADPWI